MKNYSNTSELIQRYLDNELSPDEIVFFEEKIKLDQELQQEIKLYRKVNAAISDNSLENFKNKLEEIHKRNYKSTQLLRTAPIKYLSAAAVLLLVVLGSLFIFNNSEINPEEIYNQHYLPLEYFNTKRAGNLEKQSEFEISMEIYNNKDYQAAYNSLSALLKQKPDNLAIKLYLGICAIETGKDLQAQEIFEDILYYNDPFYIQEAEWYLAMLTLKNKKLEEAKLMLQEILERKGVYYEEAGELLKDLE